MTTLESSEVIAPVITVSASNYVMSSDRKLTLDVGCGCKCLGDINVDLDLNMPCDFVVDLDTLPLNYSNKKFRKVICNHVLEHLHNPEKTLDEFLRISRVVEIRVPHKWGSLARHDPSHKWFCFNLKWFVAYAASRKVNVQGYTGFDWTRFSFRFPFPLETVAWLWE